MVDKDEDKDEDMDEDHNHSGIKLDQDKLRK